MLYQKVCRSLCSLLRLQKLTSSSAFTYSFDCLVLNCSVVYIEFLNLFSILNVFFRVACFHFNVIVDLFMRGYVNGRYDCVLCSSCFFQRCLLLSSIYVMKMYSAFMSIYLGKYWLWHESRNSKYLRIQNSGEIFASVWLLTIIEKKKMLTVSFTFLVQMFMVVSIGYIFYTHTHVMSFGHKYMGKVKKVHVSM